jgi:thioredoxin-related protein
MSKIVDAILNYASRYYFIILVVVLFVVFSIASYYGYQKYIKDKIAVTKFADVANADRNSKNATIMIFTVDWCPHCKTAKDPWDKFKSAYDGKPINGYALKCVEVDCTEDSPGNYKDEDNPSLSAAALIKQYNIKSYPTIKLVIDGGETVEFDSKITEDSLATFVNTILADA